MISFNFIKVRHREDRRVNFSLPWPMTSVETREALSFVFQTALTTYLGLYLLELLKPGLVTDFYSLDTFLWVAIITGGVSAIWPVVSSPMVNGTAKSLKDWLWIILLSLGTVVVVWYKFNSIGGLVKIIAPLSGLVVFGFSLLMYYDEEDHQAKG